VSVVDITSPNLEAITKLTVERAAQNGSVQCHLAIVLSCVRSFVRSINGLNETKIMVYGIKQVLDQFRPDVSKSAIDLWMTWEQAGEKLHFRVFMEILGSLRV
jgi:hypothetical protein